MAGVCDNAEDDCREVARLAVGGLELEPDVARRAADPDGGWRAGGAEAERAAAALVSQPLQQLMRFCHFVGGADRHCPAARLFSGGCPLISGHHKGAACTKLMACKVCLSGSSRCAPRGMRMWRECGDFQSLKAT